MRLTSPPHPRPALAALAAAAVVVPLGLVPGSAVADPTAGQTAVYIVQVSGNPLATNPATRPADGATIDVRTPAARSYRGALARKHQQVLDAVRAKGSVRDYGVSFNGFAARLTQAQADALSKRPDVLRVWKSETRYATTTRTPEFLGLAGPDGVWQKRFGGPKNAGAGMIIGVVDSGIWPESPSFAPLDDPVGQKLVDAKWKGVCDGGTGPNKVTCNNKLIGARAYWSGVTPQPFEFLTPRGYNAHGTHTAATAAGDYGVRAVNGSMDLGTVSGMAPAARIAAYKALWATPDGRASGSTVDLVAAIDQAVADGVDVINYSVSGSRTSVVGPDEVAFYYAAQAGVFVSASAGNDGDTVGTSSVAHNAPWTMTVAASTTDRPVAKSVTTGDGASHDGVGLGGGVGPAPLVDAAQAALPGADPTAAKLCLSDGDPATDGVQPVLDPAKVKGAIVLCTRGSNARVDKSLAVKNAGGVGMILANTSDAQSLNADLHDVPTVHLSATEAAPVRAYLASAGASATATIAPTGSTPVRAPEIAGFSSYGPALAGSGDLLKPDVTAPGVDIIAAVSPMGDERGKSFDAMSGTSMAAPHIAGIAALIAAKHPRWSPMAVKSAIMTTASTLDATGRPIQRSGEDATPFDMGSGHVTAPKAFEPGLVYDSTPTDWARYACGLGQAQTISGEGFCDTVGSIDPSDLNYPSIAIGDLAGTQTVTRTVTNVGNRPMTYTARVQQPTGVKVVVSPARITVPVGRSRTFTVTFTRTAAQLDHYAFGALTWEGRDGTTVRSPLAIRSVGAAVPAQIEGRTPSGSTTFTLKAGLDGHFTSQVGGLVASDVRTQRTELGHDAVSTFEVPAGTRVVRFATYDADYPKGTDVDITVTKDGKEVGNSGGATAEESVTLTDPEPGTYTVDVSAFAGPGPIDVKTHGFVVPGTPAGNLTVDPASGDVQVAQSYPVRLSWHDLDPARRYLGVVDVLTGGSRIGTTLVSVRP